MHKIALAVTFALIGPSASFVEPAPAVEASPAEYAGIPDRPFIVVVGTPQEVHATCASRGYVPKGYVVLACTLPRERIIVFPHCTEEQEAYCGRLLRHEIGHLSGWIHAVR